MINTAVSRYVKFFTKNYNLLLLCLGLLFIFRPHDENLLYLGIWKFLLTGTLLAAIFGCKHSKKIKTVELWLAIPSVFLVWLDLWLPDYHIILVIISILSVLFTLLCAASIIQDVILQSKVTFETLKGAISAYFLIAIGFAYLFSFIEAIIPGTFSINGDRSFIISYAAYLSEMLYFSFVTLLTIGYGDIVPVKDVGQTAVVIEGIIGQFYVAILVARLVSLYSLTAQMEALKKLKKE